MQKHSKVAFALTQRPAGLPETIQMLIVPIEGSGNEFGFHVRTRIGIRTDNSIFRWVSGYLAFRGEGSHRTYLERRIEGSRQAFIRSDDDLLPFITMLLKVEDYQVFIEICGRDSASALAAEAVDVANLNFAEQLPLNWNDYATSEVFTLGFMRMSESAFAYYNGGSVLAGRKLDAIDARAEFSARVEFHKGLLEYQFTFKPGRLSENRIAALIGPNGSGKTQSLIAINKAFLAVRNAGAHLSPTPRFNQILVFAHSKTSRRFRLPRRHPSFGTQRVFGFEPVASSSCELTSLIARILRSDDYQNDGLLALRDVLETEFRSFDLSVPVILNDGATTPTQSYLGLRELMRPTGEHDRLLRIGGVDLERPLRFVGSPGTHLHLSIGQSVFVAFAIRALAHAGPASAILIDEPENFLHPNLVSQFVRILHTVLSRTRSIALIATHSPYLVRELGRTQVHVLRTDPELELHFVEKPRLQTLGANIAAISDDVFHDDLPDHLYLERLRDSTYLGESVATLIERLKDELSLDALMRLRAIVERRSDVVDRE